MRFSPQATGRVDQPLCGVFEDGEGGAAPNDIVGCHNLWNAVLLTAVLDAKQPRDTLDRYKARKWIGSKDFYEVCALAGHDGDWLWDNLRHLTA